MKKNFGNDLIELQLLLAANSEGFDSLKKNKSNLITARIKMLTLLADGSATPSELMTKIGLAKSNMTTLCQGLIADGLMGKVGDTQDKRIVHYFITEAGEEYLEGVTTEISKNFLKIIAYRKNTKEVKQKVKELIKLLK